MRRSHDLSRWRRGYRIIAVSIVKGRPRMRGCRFGFPFGSRGVGRDRGSFLGIAGLGGRVRDKDLFRCLSVGLYLA
jgi:hypothetical protein